MASTANTLITVRLEYSSVSGGFLSWSSSQTNSLLHPASNNSSLRSVTIYSPTSTSLGTARRNRVEVRLRSSSTSFVPTMIRIGNRTYSMTQYTFGSLRGFRSTVISGLPTADNSQFSFVLLNSAGQALDITDGQTATPTTQTTYTPPTPTNVAPSISSFKIFTVGGMDLGTSTTVTSGTTVNLRWAITGTPTPTFHVRVSGSSSNLATSGTSLNVSPTSTTTYTLTASNTQGSVTRQVTVTVRGVTAVRPAITSFTAEAIGVSAAQTIAVSSGAQVILRWTITGTPTPTFHVRLQGTNTNLATTGTSVNVTPARTSVYVLTATNSAGSAAANVRVNVPRTNLIRVGTKVPNHIFLGTTPVRRVYLGRGTGVDPLLLYRQENPPTITTFTVAPSTIDLDTRPSGTITFTINVTGVIQEQTLAQIVQLPNGNNIGATIVAAAGSNIAQTLPNILQPTQTTSYRLFARNIEGVSHRDFTVTLTQNARISNFRRTGFSQRPDGTRFQFTARISGTPQPVVTWRFGNGRQSQRDNDSIHFTSVGTNQWDAVWGGAAGIIHPVVSDSLVWTVRNSTGSATATISNIST